jgi:ferrochelatase
LRTAVVLFNLGGPDSLDAVEPFLRNLFSDPAIIGLPAFLRHPFARFAARRRALIAREIYAKLGGASPINAETSKQAEALEAALAARGRSVRTFVAMRCWRPLISETFGEIRRWSPERIVLLPLYPQYSITTTASSLAEWERLSRPTELDAKTVRVCCYPQANGFVDAMAGLIQDTLTRAKPNVDYRLLLSAHGLPKRTAARGDPYPWQVEQTAKAVVQRLGIMDLDWRLTFQSRVGPLAWIEPATDVEIRNAGNEAKGVIVAPIAFVCEHSETLVELDIEYAGLARHSGVPDYLRVPTVGAHPLFISALAGLVEQALDADADLARARSCPGSFERCARGKEL